MFPWAFLVGAGAVGAGVAMLGKWLSEDNSGSSSSCSSFSTPSSSYAKKSSTVRRSRKSSVCSKAKSASSASAAPAAGIDLRGLPRIEELLGGSPAAGRGWLDAVVKDSDCEAQGGSFCAYDPMGTAVTLGGKEEIGAGGEGTVYSIPGKKNCLAKIYKGDILRDDARREALSERIQDMCAIYSKAGESMKFCAWPVMPIFDGADASTRRFIGFVMRRCGGKSLRELFGGPVDVNRRYPGMGRSGLAEIAMDLVSKVKTLADMGIYVNDFNPANFLLSQKDGKFAVSFIDCDSYQVPSRKGGQPHITSTYYASHVAPELLKNKALLRSPRGVRQVEFGTAILAYQILMCGLHPYDNRDMRVRGECASPEENLQKGCCPLGKGSNVIFPNSNWYKLWSWVTYSLKSVFIRTFRDGHGDPEARPSLEELKIELFRFIQQIRLDKGKNATPPRDSLTPAEKNLTTLRPASSTGAACPAASLGPGGMPPQKKRGGFFGSAGKLTTRTLNDGDGRKVH